MIDTATGLPELPEEHFWRVTEQCAEIRLTVRDGEWRFGHGHPGDETRIRKVGLWPFQRSVPEYRARSKRVWAAYTDPVLNPDGSVKTYTPVDSWGVSAQQTVFQPVTPENIVELTQRALTEWRANASRRALLGDYPPKKFEGAS